MVESPSNVTHDWGYMFGDCAESDSDSVCDVETWFAEQWGLDGVDEPCHSGANFAFPRLVSYTCFRGLWSLHELAHNVSYYRLRDRSVLGLVAALGQIGLHRRGFELAEVVGADAVGVVVVDDRRARGRHIDFDNYYWQSGSY